MSLHHPYYSYSTPLSRSPCKSFKALPVTLANSELDEQVQDVHVHISNCILDIDHQLSLDQTDRLYRQPKKGFQRSNYFAYDGNLGSGESGSKYSFTVIPLLQVIAAATPIRSLTAAVNSPSNLYDEMTALATQPPGSPPSLTGSRSSKSSSLHSSSLSGANVVLLDITNFEDIGLDEDHPVRDQSFDNSDKKRVNLPVAVNTMKGSTGNNAAISNTRELTNGATRPPYPNLHSQIGGITSSVPVPPLRLPPRAPGKKGFRNSSTPTLAMTAMTNLTRSRSPSPSHTSAPASTALIPRRASLQPQGLPTEAHMLPQRRGSWQPNRKTVKELEDEYNDLDEDLPEDASLWNVPLSPRPPTERTSISAIQSAQTSPSTSPERVDPLRSRRGGDVIAPSQPPPDQGARFAGRALSISPDSANSAASVKPKFPHGAPTGTLPHHSYFPASRSKSWNVALSELSEEAQYLTEALEIYAGNTEGQQERAVQSGAPPSGRSPEKLSRANTSPLELPPLRTSDMMIDPLPISKEKEKVLSRTRPSWLPPKDRKEEKKHLKQYQRIMQLSLHAERKKAAQAVDRQCAQDDTKNALLRIWEEHVLPNWDQVIREPRTRELWWRGVAPSSRAKVWERAVGNDLALTDGTYLKALQRAQQLETHMSQARPDERFKEKAWFRAIRRDIKTVFPELKIFQPGGPLHDGLLDVLMAYSIYRSDVGYCHGTHLIAALLFLILPTPASTFWTLANLLNRPLLMAFLTGDPSSIQKTYKVVMSLVSVKFPRLHSHLFTSSGLNLAPHEVLEPMIRTLFLGPGDGLGIEIASRVWDIMMFDGDAAVVRAAAAVLGGLEGKLYGNREEVLRVLGWGGIGWAGCGAGVDEFIRGLRSVGKEDKGRKKTS